MLELIMVILIIGILAVAVMGRLPGSVISLHAQARQLAQEIRHTRALAMNRSGSHTIRNSGSASYEVTNGVEILSSGTLDSVSFQSGFSILFDGRGSPDSFEDIAITLNSGGESLTLVVVGDTGAVRIP
ncbi:MAG: hypothetical protein HQL52_09455 [Magnetococcales bacterium]|nr:hypothetical protein [Magnetococcales bacterium]